MAMRHALQATTSNPGTINLLRLNLVDSALVSAEQQEAVIMDMLSASRMQKNSNIEHQDSCSKSQA